MVIKDKRDLVSDGLVSIEEAALFTTLSDCQIRNLINDRTIPSVKMGRRLGIPKKALIEYLAERLVVR
jgi:excisionase family DNA binding protein